MPLQTLPTSPAVHQVSEFFESLFADIDAMRPPLRTLFAAGPVTSAAALDAVQRPARRLLDQGIALGAGYVASPGVLRDQSLYLAWWQGDNRQLLGDSPAPASGDPLDYTRREWFRVPVRTGHRHVTGPYVDYICSDEYVVTCTVPVIVDGHVVGVAGADVLAETLERLLMPVLQAEGATLLGDHGQTMVSADHHISPGVVATWPAEYQQEPCGDLPVSVMLRS